MTLLRTLLWFVVAAAAMFAAVWLAERPGTVTAEWHGWRLDTSVGVILIAVVVLVLLSIARVAALSLDRRRAGRAARRLGRKPPPARLSRADARAGRRGGRRWRGGAEECAQGRGAALGAAAHPASVGAGRPAHRRSRRRQKGLQRHARGRADGLPRPARADRPGAARRRPGPGAGLRRARLQAQAADAVGRAFAVRHAGPDRPLARGAGHARRRPAPQGRDRRRRAAR